jgi:putative transcriptional regulator
MRLRNALRESRLKRDLTQVALAEMVGVTRQTIIAIEKEKFVPSAKLALEISRALDMPFQKIFWLEE